ncbi:MAG TPA: hypothetical protein VGD52_27050 [Pseudoduganella sp.]
MPVLKKAIKTLLVLLAAVFIFALLIETRLAIATLFVTFFIGWAIAGPARWLAWTVVFIIASAFTMAVLHVLAKSASGGLLAGVLGFGILPLTPAFFLWLASMLRRLHD